MRKVIIFHNFTPEELTELLEIIKRSYSGYKDTIIAQTTPTSLKMVLHDLINELIKEDDYFTGKIP